MFQFPGSARSSPQGRPSRPARPGGCPIRSPPDPCLLRGSPGPFVACHDLLRPSAPEASPVCFLLLPPLKLSRSATRWWAEVDLNHRPPAYQAGALTPALSAPCAPAAAGGPGPPKPYHHVGRPLPRKEVIQPHLPIRLPCYDFTPITHPTVDGVALAVRPPGFGCGRLSWCDGRCVQGPGTNSPRHADPRLLAIPASCRRVAACNPN